jgi:hypothetical protein
LKNKINIALILISLFTLNYSYSNEKFVKIKGVVSHHSALLTNFSIHVNYDDIDSSTTLFEKEKFELWLPANRKAKVSFIKKGFVTIHMIVDASFIPSFAYKKKQLIEFNVKMIQTKDFQKLYLTPFCIANFKASETRFILTYRKSEKEKPIKKFSPPFPTPYSIFKGAKPANKFLPTIKEVNKDHTSKNHSYFKLTQGILYANLNYTIFNEKINHANAYLNRLVKIEKEGWDNLKPFDTPEYAAIVLKVVHNEQTKDTLFALGAWVGTSQLLFQSFSSNSKLIIHGKKLSYALNQYTEFGLDESQKKIIASLRELAIMYDQLVKKYTLAMKNKSPLKLMEDILFLQIKSENQTIYNTIIQ